MAIWPSQGQRIRCEPFPFRPAYQYALMLHGAHDQLQALTDNTTKPPEPRTTASSWAAHGKVWARRPGRRIEGGLRVGRVGRIEAVFGKYYNAGGRARTIFQKS